MTGFVWRRFRHRFNAAAKGQNAAKSKSPLSTEKDIPGKSIFGDIPAWADAWWFQGATNQGFFDWRHFFGL